MKSKNQSRIRTLWIVMVAVSLVYIGQLYIIQVVNGETYRERAEHQYLSPSIDAFDRGSIYFTDKNGASLPVATLQTGFTLSINPKLVPDAEAEFRAINKIYEIGESDFIQKAGQKADSYEEIAKRIPEDKASAISGLKLPGVALTREKWRYYPAGNLAAHAIGFVGYDGDVLSGRYGLERYYNDVLARSDSGGAYSNFFADIFSDVKKTVGEGKFEGDLVSSIEPTVEMQLQAIIDGVEKKYSSAGTGGIIIDPMTGKIIAMAYTPTFDLNTFNKQSDPSVFSNPLVEDVYEMGSIVKALTMAAGLDSGTVTAESTYDDKGFLALNGARISNYDGKGRGVIDMQEVLNQSLNTGAAFVALKMGHELYSKYMLDYGIGEETGIDLPNETHGLTSNLSSPRDLEYATASFGQGIAMTPIETARALSSLANGGYLVTPQLVQRINYKIGGFRNMSPDPGKKILKSSTSEEITRMLVHVYDYALLKGAVKMPNYSIAAKTGTAQIAAPGGGYYKDRYLHSFFGYFPAYNPRFLILLYTVYPKNVEYASETLTMPFYNLAKFLINYYTIPPDR